MPYEEFNKLFAKNLRYYLNKYNMTQAELAKHLNVGTTSVYNWCNGIKSPRMDKVDAMCELFNCKRSNLMEDKKMSFFGWIPRNGIFLRLQNCQLLFAGTLTRKSMFAIMKSRTKRLSRARLCERLCRRERL